MTAHDTIAAAIRFTGASLDGYFDRVSGDPDELADAAIAAIRGMPHNELAELLAPNASDAAALIYALEPIAKGAPR